MKNRAEKGGASITSIRNAWQTLTNQLHKGLVVQEKKTTQNISISICMCEYTLVYMCMGKSHETRNGLQEVRKSS